MTRIIPLLGGSFNPPHEAHIKMASYIQNTLQADETWLLFSENPDKDPLDYASLEHRMNMADILVRHYNAPVKLSDMEDKIAQQTGRHETYYVLQGLQEHYPDTKFVWVMGADSFAGFHQWAERDLILNNYIIAIVDRPGYTEQALSSPTAVEFATQKIDLTDGEQLRNATHGWGFLNTPHIPVSSSGLMKQIRSGKTDFTEPFDQVAAYIYEHGLYGTTPSQHKNFRKTLNGMV
jgi:nicotinate-nucleotide adenylyltransferase